MIPEVREVRVTARRSVKTPFVAPDLSPVQPHLAIDVQHAKDWTDHKARVDSPVNGGRIKGRAQRELAALRVGKPIPKASQSRRRPVATTGPTAEYKAMRERAERLAQLEGIA